MFIPTLLILLLLVIAAIAVLAMMAVFAAFWASVAAGLYWVILKCFGRTGLFVVTAVGVVLAAAAVMRIKAVQGRPPAPMIVSVTPAQFTVDYYFCFDAEDEVHIEPSNMIEDYKYDARGNDASNGYAQRGYSNSVNRLFGRRITVTSADPNTPVKFRIWEQPRGEPRPYWSCCNNDSGCRD
ncbi:MAG: hypothetical protein HYZ50_14485 [Deltaproteobacteria bacterium]|nr:hypothetical protein [Deltaproteobacteria bacterium]